MAKNTDQETDLIKVTEAAHILGFKQRKKVDNLIEKGHLKTHCKKNSKLIWLSRKEVYDLPKPLPVPPTIELKTPAANKRPTA